MGRILPVLDGEGVRRLGYSNAEGAELAEGGSAFVKDMKKSTALQEEKGKSWMFSSAILLRAERLCLRQVEACAPLFGQEDVDWAT